MRSETDRSGEFRLQQSFKGTEILGPVPRVPHETSARLNPPSLFASIYLLAVPLLQDGKLEYNVVDVRHFALGRSLLKISCRRVT